MTVYYVRSYQVGGQYTHGGDIETEHDTVPADVLRLWEIDPYPAGDTRPWVRGDDDFWTIAGEDGLELTTVELLDEFGPLSDDEADAAIGMDELRARESVVHLLYPVSEVAS